MKIFYVHKLCFVICCVFWSINLCCSQLNNPSTGIAADDEDLLMSGDNVEYGLQEQFTTLSPMNNQFQTVTNQFIPQTTRKRKKPGRKRKRRPNQQRLQQLQLQAQRQSNHTIEVSTSAPLVLEQPEPEIVGHAQPIIYEPEPNVPYVPHVDKSYRRPYSEARKQEKENSDSSPATDIKNILKHADGLSLSEILQQRNLSLADLLKGKQIAISAITQPTKLESSEPKITKYVSKPDTVRRLPSLSRHTIESDVPGDFILITSTKSPSLDINDDLAIESSNGIPPTIPNIRDRFSKTDRPIKEVIPSIRPDLSNSNSKRLSNLFANRKNNDRIPTNFKDKINKVRPTTIIIENLETTTIEYEPTGTTAIPSTSTVRSKFQPLRPRLRLNSKGILVTTTSPSSTTSATTSTTTTTTTTTTEIPTTVKPRKQLKNLVEPLENLFRQFRPQYEIRDNLNHDHTQRSFIDYDNEDIDVTEMNPSLFADITSIRSVDDRTDLLELMEDRRSGARLVKVLSQRNMTLDELIEHRNRGSSQLHLSEIFYNKSAPLSNHKLSVAPDKMDVVTAFETFPLFNLDTLKSVKPDEIKTDSQGASYFTSIFDIKPTDEVYKEGRSLKIDKKNSQPNNDVVLSMIKPTTTRSLEFDESMFTELEDIDNSLARVNDKFDLELSGQDYRRNSITIDTSESSIPIGIKSAILASSCIVVISVLLFVLIFVACRWRQNRNNKLEYHEESLKGRGKAPILERNLSNCSTSPTLYQMSRSNKLNTMDPNSPEVQDYLYDAMRHPF